MKNHVHYIKWPEININQLIDKMNISNDLKNIFDMMNSLLEKEGKFFQVGKN